MRVYWTQETFAKEEMKALIEDNVSPVPVYRLQARIARRYGRLKRRGPSWSLVARETQPVLPEAA